MTKKTTKKTTTKTAKKAAKTALAEALTRMRYLPGGGVPTSVKAGSVLVHNGVVPAGPKQPVGKNGFRAWEQDLDPVHLVRCRCGWSGLPHYTPRISR